MPRAAQDKPYSTFITGFITEATELNFPENALKDVDNCDIDITGRLRRRLGLNEEAGGYTVGAGLLANTLFTAGTNGGVYSNTLAANVTVPAEQIAVTAHVWPTPAGQEGLYLVVLQIGNTLIFRNWDGAAVSDPNFLNGLVLNPGLSLRIDNPTGFSNSGFVYKTTVDVCAATPLQGSVGFGRMWMSSSAVFPFYLEYDPVTKLITANPIGYDAAVTIYQHGRMDIRDFNGVPDGLQPNQWQASLTQEHEYNLVNQGWDAPTPIVGNVGTVQYYVNHSATAQYPPNNMQWFRGQDITTTPPGGFNPVILDQISFGNTLAPRGSVTINALTGSKDHIPTQSPTFPVLNFNGKYDEPSTTGFETVAFYAGRVWLAGDTNLKRSNGVYFSATLRKISDSGVFMQVGDPTSEYLSDLLATDGGVIYITGADRIIKLIPFGAGILVFAHNGVWMISGDGTGGGFTANNFTIQQVSSTGLIGPNALSASDQALFYFSQNSVIGVTLPAQGTIPIVQDIGRQKVFTFYNKINRDARTNARAVYDEISKKIFFFYLDEPTYSYPSFQTAYNKMLILDTRTGSFTKYSFTVTIASGSTFFALSGGFTDRYPVQPEQIDLVYRGVDQVLVGTDNVVTFEPSALSENFINNYRVIVSDAANQCVQILQFYDLGFTDFATMGANATDYVSYAQTHPETLGDLQRDKQATYVHTFFTRTEDGFLTNPDGNLTASRPSKCTFQGQWDWQNTATGNRWSRVQQAYRYKRPYTPTGPSDTYDTGEGVIHTKLKVRGEGRALSCLYTSVTGYDFELLGFSIPYTANSV